MTQSASLTIEIRGKTYETTDNGDRNDVFAVSLGKSLTDGTGADQFSKTFRDTRTLAASANESLDLAGVLTDAFGATLTFTAIKAIIVKAKSTNTNDVIVGGAASNAFLGPFADATDKIKIKPGQAFAITNLTAAGWSVTAGTGDLLKIENSSSGTGVDYEIIILGI